MNGSRRPPKARGQYVADVDEIRPQYVLDAPDANALFASDIVRMNGASIASTINQLENAVVNDINSEWRLALPSYSDQVLPFNVTLAGANEYGAMCASKILGIEILNEGSGISVDDAVTESQATFVARGIEPLQAVTLPYNQGSSSFPKQKPSRAREGETDTTQQPIQHTPAGSQTWGPVLFEWPIGDLSPLYPLIPRSHC
jgi:hypothetical protein